MRRKTNIPVNRFLEQIPIAMHMQRPHLLLTNDDGIRSRGILELARALHIRGHPLAILAPLREHSACGMKLTLRDDMAFVEHREIADEIRTDDAIPLRVFSLDGSPCDCVIVSIDGGLGAWAPEISPRMCISGINRGPNLSVDVLHSGTVSAAREASLYGMPSIATSLATYSHEDYEQSIDATISIIDSMTHLLDKPLTNLGRPDGTRPRMPNDTSPESIRSWFLSGNLFLNLNVPGDWNGSFRTVALGARWYHNATDMMEGSEIGVAFEVGAATIEDEDIPNSDCNAVGEGFASITPLESWPSNHPLGVPETILQSSMEEGDDGLPSWF